jgi:NADH dehydrogenase
MEPDTAPPIALARPHPDRPRVVVVGGGFAGLEVAKRLEKADVQVVLIDRRNHHLFQPLLYQVATATLSPADIAQPLRKILRSQANALVVLGDVQAIDRGRRELVLERTRVRYDWLVLAAGVRHSYFGHDEWAAHAPGLKDLDEALELRRRFLAAFERAEMEADDAARRRALTFVVVGGGPTGVELAGAMSEIAKRTIPSDFRRIDTRTARVVLLEAGPRVLAAYPEHSSEAAERQLRELGVEVRTDAPVTGIDAHGVDVGDDRIEANNVFWAAGMQGSPLARSLGVELDRAGRVLVRGDLTVDGEERVFAIGDMAAVTDPESGEPVPGVAPAALQMGRYVGDLIARESAGRGRADDREPFRYFDKGSMATIGRNRAVAVIGERELDGRPAWLMWALIHVYFLIGLRNRVFVMLSWIWSYVVHDRGARLITGEVEQGVEIPIDLDAPTAAEGVGQAAARR